MAGNIKGITIEIGGDTSKLQNALKDVNSTSRDLNKQLRDVNKSLKFNPKNVEVAEQKQRTLANAIENTKKKLELLKTAQEQAKQALADGKIGQDQYDALTREVLKCENQLKSLQQQANKSAQELKKISDSAMKVSETTGKIGSKMTKAVTAPIVGMGALVTKFAADFDTAMVGVAKTVDMSDEEFQQMSNSIRQMAKEMPASAEEIAGVAEAAGQLGIKKENILDFTKTMIDMGETTNLTADEAANAFARFANITQLPQSEFKNLGSVVVDLGNNMATTEKEIVNMGMRLAGAGSQVGLTQAEIMGLAAAMSSVGIEAEAGGSAMSTTMSKINSAVVGSTAAYTAFNEEMKGVGVTYDDVARAVEQGGAALENMSKKTGYSTKGLKELTKEIGGGINTLNGFAMVAGMSADEFAKKWKEKPTEAITAFVKGLKKVQENGGDVTGTLKDLGINGLREVDTLKRLSGAGDLLGEAFQRSNQAFKENTALGNEAAKRYESFGAKLDIFKNKAKDAGISLGQALLPAVTKVVEGLGKLADKFSSMSPATQKVILVFAGLAAAIGPLLLVISKVAAVIGTVTGAMAIMAGGATAGATPAMIGLAGVMTKLGAVFTAIKGAVIAFAGTLGLPVAGVVAIGAAVAALVVVVVKHWDTIKAKTIEIFGAIKEFILKVWDGVSEAWSAYWQGVWDSISRLWKSFIQTVKPIWEPIKNVFKFLWEAIKEIFNIGWQLTSAPIKIAWQAFVALAKTIFEGLKQVFKTVWEAIKNITTTVWNAIKNFLTPIWNGIKSVATTVFNAIKSVITTIWNNVKSVTSNVWNSIKGVLSSIFNSIKSVASSAFNSIKSVITNVWNAVKSTTSSIWNGIKSVVTSIVNSMKGTITSVFNSIKSVTSSIWNGIKNAIATPINAVVGVVRNAITRMKSILNISLPTPRLKLPHPRVSGRFSLNPPQVPHFSIDWYDKGGIFSNPTIIGVGEKRPEFVGALDDLKGIVAEVIDTRMGKQQMATDTGFTITIQNMEVRNDSDIERIAQQLHRLMKKEQRGR